MQNEIESIQVILNSWKQIKPPIFASHMHNCILKITVLFKYIFLSIIEKFMLTIVNVRFVMRMPYKRKEKA